MTNHTSTPAPRVTTRDHLEDVQTFERADQIALRNLEPERVYAEKSPYVDEWNPNHDDEQGSVWAGALTERPRGLETALEAWRRRKAEQTSPDVCICDISPSCIRCQGSPL